MPESEERPRFPVRLQIQKYSGIHDDWYWSTLCIVYDVESMRLLQQWIPETIIRKEAPA